MKLEDSEVSVKSWHWLIKTVRKYTYCKFIMSNDQKWMSSPRITKLAERVKCLAPVKGPLHFLFSVVDFHPFIIHEKKLTLPSVSQPD